MITLLLSCLVFAAPAFDDCSKDVDVHVSKSDLTQKLPGELKDAATFKQLLDTVQRYSACPEHEPGADAYSVFESVSARIEGASLILEYEVTGRVRDKGNGYRLVPDRKTETVTYTLFKTTKGWRAGDRETRTWLGRGVYMPAAVMRERFKLP